MDISVQKTHRVSAQFQINCNENRGSRPMR